MCTCLFVWVGVFFEKSVRVVPQLISRIKNPFGRTKALLAICLRLKFTATFNFVLYLAINSDTMR